MKKITLFLIDDDEEVVNALAAIFRPNKRFKVRAHTTVAAALQDTGQHPPQLVICDHLMPEHSGIETLRQLRRRFPLLRSILLTGQSLADEEITRGMNEGVVDLYISKPWNQAELTETVQRMAREAAKSS